MDDSQLIAGCLDGRVDEYRKIVEKYQGKMMAIALNILGNKEDAEDVCQEAFIRAYRHLDRFDPEKNFRVWISSIVCRCCFDVLRRKRRFFSFLARSRRELAVNFPPEALHPERVSHLPDKLLDQLSPRERMAVVLWAGESCSSSEIAEVMGCSSSTARVYLFSARKKIKGSMEKAHASM